MKYLVVSDIHGNDKMITKLYKIVSFHQPTKIILLGDLGGFFHPNDRILDFIEEYKDKIILIKGNCDDREQYKMDMLDYYKETINGVNFVFTHGHLMLPISTSDYDVFVQGHTHIGKIREYDNKIIFNPGSLSQPRGESVNSYGLITDNDIELYDINDSVIKKLSYRK
jgi:putative phosphoesterase